MTALSQTDLPTALQDQIADCGFFPELIADSVITAVGCEPIVNYLVQHEATLAREEINRHMSVLVITPTRLVISHTDESPDDPKGLTAICSSESIRLDRINSVGLTKVVTYPDRGGMPNAQVNETWLSVGWGALRRVELEPARCADPTCELDHGYAGSVAADDMTVRMSPTGDGAANVARLIEFATVLQRMIGQHD